MRINKLLSNYGICSRKEARTLIENNRIKVNGELCIQGQWVEEDDVILLDDKKVSKKERIYIVFNKPIGVTCTAAKEVKGNIIDFINYKEYIFPVGRLDKESQGLILLTNDGDFASEILESENLHEKEYVVRVDKPFEESFIESMARGVKILDTVTRPCIVTRISEDTFSIILTQGLNKQIRRMTRVFGYKVIFLERIRIMNINLNGMGQGEWRYLTEEELKKNTKLR
jgi:23S rRNA pseudouridine2604 synthase